MPLAGTLSQFWLTVQGGLFPWLAAELGGAEWEAEAVGGDLGDAGHRELRQAEQRLCGQAAGRSAGDCAGVCLQGGLQPGDDVAVVRALGERRNVAALVWLGAGERRAERGNFLAARLRNLRSAGCRNGCMQR